MVIMHTLLCIEIVTKRLKIFRVNDLMVRREKQVKGGSVALDDHKDNNYANAVHECMYFVLQRVFSFKIIYKFKYVNMNDGVFVCIYIVISVFL